MKQAETIKSANDWLDAILSKLEQSDHPAAVADIRHVRRMLAPLCPKPSSPKIRGFEDLTVKLDRAGLRQFIRDDAAAVKASEQLPCVLCRQPVKFARLAFWYSPVKKDCGYAHLGCFQKAEMDRDYRWSLRGASEYDPEKAVVCLCGHGYAAHRADKSHGGTDYIECEATDYPFKPNGESLPSIPCECDHFRPGGTLKETTKPELTTDDDGNRDDSEPISAAAGA